jgi:hypothetical protein
LDNELGLLISNRPIRISLYSHTTVLQCTSTFFLDYSAPTTLPTTRRRCGCARSRQATSCSPLTSRNRWTWEEFESGTTTGPLKTLTAAYVPRIILIPPITYYWTESPNIGPLISCWELDKFKNCWNKSFRTSKILTLLYQQFSNLLISQWLQCPNSNVHVAILFSFWYFPNFYSPDLFVHFNLHRWSWCRSSWTECLCLTSASSFAVVLGTRTTTLLRTLPFRSPKMKSKSRSTSLLFSMIYTILRAPLSTV